MASSRRGWSGIKLAARRADPGIPARVNLFPPVYQPLIVHDGDVGSRAAESGHPQPQE